MAGGLSRQHALADREQAVDRPATPGTADRGNNPLPLRQLAPESAPRRFLIPAVERRSSRVCERVRDAIIHGYASADISEPTQ